MKEKSNLVKFVTVVIAAIVLSYIVSIGLAVYYVNSNGGFKQSVIGIGKDVRKIGQEIGKEIGKD